MSDDIRRKAGRWFVTGGLLGACAGVVWAVLGSSGYELGDVAIGMGLMGMLLGLIVAVVAVLVADSRR